MPPPVPGEMPEAPLPMQEPNMVPGNLPKNPLSGDEFAPGSPPVV